ncbi:hypothetical protein EVAR_89802_1 [Eumeta japonica]|uniref:Uncharacterized protein n=1 Tax=Eumeta variegata TaxID=151549 RepID=A0A4C2A116_EUMVA|nr:hypothetical protein EVAR_89802_1 [Eumeta japonica]
MCQPTAEHIIPVSLSGFETQLRIPSEAPLNSSSLNYFHPFPVPFQSRMVQDPDYKEGVSVGKRLTKRFPRSVDISRVGLPPIVSVHLQNITDNNQ